MACFLYIWEGWIQPDAEVLLVMKTTVRKFTAPSNRIIANELPELIALPVCAGSERYLEWVRQTVAAN
ncbi:MAG: divalent-cation tolerance protein CutA [Candidatus Obscuribacterales bacterium]|nr:divalent-cation tolerance protein CutA [Steroidobacteraceae bacterium]